MVHRRSFEEQAGDTAERLPIGGTTARGASLMPATDPLGRPPMAPGYMR